MHFCGYFGEFCIFNRQRNDLIFFSECLHLDKLLTTHHICNRQQISPKKSKLNSYAFACIKFFILELGIYCHAMVNFSWLSCQCLVSDTHARILKVSTNFDVILPCYMTRSWPGIPFLVCFFIKLYQISIQWE